MSYRTSNRLFYSYILGFFWAAVYFFTHPIQLLKLSIALWGMFNIIFFVTFGLVTLNLFQLYDENFNTV